MNDIIRATARIYYAHIVYARKNGEICQNMHFFYRAINDWNKIDSLTGRAGMLCQMRPSIKLISELCVKKDVCVN